MSEFRRSIIDLADSVQLLLIIAATILGGLVGTVYPSILTPLGYDQGWVIVGLIVGGICGFLGSVVTAAVYFAISEIAANSRASVELLRAQAEARTRPSIEGPKSSTESSSATTDVIDRLINRRRLSVKTPPVPPGCLNPLQMEVLEMPDGKSLSLEALEIVQRAMTVGYRFKEEAGEE